MVLLPDVGPEAVGDIGFRVLTVLRAHRLQAAVMSGPIELPGLMASAGAPVFPLHGNTVDELFLADAAEQRAQKAAAVRLSSHRCL